MMIDTRIFYEKRGRIRYTSHLDMNRLMQRALARTHLPVWFTQGFNPHLYLTFPLPLSLGFESAYEMMDIRLTEPLPAGEVLGRLNAQLPAGLSVFEVAPPVLPAAKVAFCDYAIALPWAVQEELEGFFSAPIVVDKKTKRGISAVDIRPHMQLLGIEGQEGKTRLSLRCESGPVFSVNPSLAMAAFCAAKGCDAADIDYLKTAVRAADGELFR